MFSIYPDHKPLTNALHSKPDCYLPYKYWHIKGLYNSAANVLFCVHTNSLYTTAFFALQELTVNQENEELLKLQNSSSYLSFKIPSLLSSPGYIWCDNSMGHKRSYAPKKDRYFFSVLCTLSHPGANSTMKLKSVLRIDQHNSKWLEYQSLILLGIHCTVKEKTGTTLAELCMAQFLGYLDK